VFTNIPGENANDRFLVMSFRIASVGTVDATNQTIDAGPFLYLPERSTNLRNRSEDPDHFRTVVNSSPFPLPSNPTGLVRTTTALGTPGTPKEFLNLRIFRK